jgi:hypothetical protein
MAFAVSVRVRLRAPTMISKPKNVRQLRIEAPHFVAGAVFVKHGSEWRCEYAAPILKWMVGKEPAWIKSRLESLKYRYMWL